MKRKFSKEEVHKDTLIYFNGDELATNVWMTKYALRDLDNNYYESNPTDFSRTLPRYQSL